jgi:hypothetical protein
LLMSLTHQSTVSGYYKKSMLDSASSFNVHRYTSSKMPTRGKMWRAIVESFSPGPRAGSRRLLYHVTARRPRPTESLAPVPRPCSPKHTRERPPKCVSEGPPRLVRRGAATASLAPAADRVQRAARRRRVLDRVWAVRACLLATMGTLLSLLRAQV